MADLHKKQRIVLSIKRKAVFEMGLFAITFSLIGWSPVHERKLSLPELGLTALLDKLTDYAGRLENVALDFVCREQIEEKIDYTLDARASSPMMDIWGYSSGVGFPVHIGVPKVTNNSYVYDYQCIRKDRIIHESRTLLEKNKVKINEPNSRLMTEAFVYENALLGPVGIFAKRVRPLFAYKIAGRDKFDKKPVVIIEAVPVDENADLHTLYGKAWVDSANADILKIEWGQKHVGRFDIFQERAERYNLKPRITIRSEFQILANGIRFPNLLFLEEAYTNKRSRAVIRSETTVTYKDFKFFTVEVEIR